MHNYNMIRFVSCENWQLHLHKPSGSNSAGHFQIVPVIAPGTLALRCLLNINAYNMFNRLKDSIVNENVTASDLPALWNEATQRKSVSQLVSTYRGCVLAAENGGLDRLLRGCR